MTHVSYIIPCYKSAETLSRCTESILGQVGGFTREIIVVDSSPPEYGRYVALREGMQVHYTEKRMYPGQARNMGLKIALGTHIALIDSDVVLNPDWTSRMLADHARLTSAHKAHVILSGSLENDLLTRTVWSDALVMIEFYQVLPSSRESEAYVLPSANLFTAGTTLQCLDMRFPPGRMGEDILFCREAVSKGIRLFLVGPNKVSHITRKNYLRYTFYLGLTTSMLRMVYTTPWKKAAFGFVLPLGSLYKLGAITKGILRNNPRHLASLLRQLPIVMLGLLSLHAGMLAYPCVRSRWDNKDNPDALSQTETGPLRDPVRMPPMEHLS